MATMDQIVDLFDKFGTDLENDLLASFDAKGHSSPGEKKNQSSLQPRFQLIYGKNNVLTFRLYINDYTDFIDKGTRPARRKIGIAERQKKINSLMSWAQRRGINALAWYKKKLKDPSKSKMTYDKAKKSLANAISHNVAKKGIIKRFGYKGSGFYSSVVNDGRVNQLKADLSEMLGREIEIELS